MTELSRITAGQPVAYCPTAGSAPADKWAILDALTQAAPHLELSHRSLTVLRALLSFYPDRVLPHDAGSGVVYPSNRVLSERLQGMPESTLRRHLATLVRAGLVVRRDSANRKRFARFGGVSFGFDLSPLARMATDLFDAAQQVRQTRAMVSGLRARIAAARQTLLDMGHDPADPLIEESRLCLRRKLMPDALEPLAIALETQLDQIAPTVKMSASNSETERHIQNTDDSDSVYKQPAHASSDQTHPTRPPALSEVVESCREYQGFFPTPHPDWPTLTSVVRRLHPMMGIDAQVFEDAQRSLGRESAVTTVLCMLEIMGTIKSPGAYLRALCQRADRGVFNMKAMLAAARSARLSADNSGCAQV